eukprot:702001-Pyramimonas_sp.AAC.1
MWCNMRGAIYLARSILFTRCGAICVQAALCNKRSAIYYVQPTQFNICYAVYAVQAMRRKPCGASYVVQLFLVQSMRRTLWGESNFSSQ